MEDPRGVGSLFSQPQPLRRAGGQEDGPGPGVGLGVPGYQPSAFFFTQCTGNAEGALSPIEVATPEVTDIIQPQTGGESRVEGVTTNRVTIRRLMINIL